MTTKEQLGVMALREVMDDLNGIRETLDALAGLKGSYSDALRLLSIATDKAFATIDEIADVLEKAHGMNAEGVA